MKKSLTTRQGCLILFIAMLCNKVLSLNSSISYYAQNDTWIVFLLSFVIDFMFILIFCFLLNKIDKPILIYIKEKFGKPVGVVIAILLSVLLVFKATEILVDVYLFFVQLIYADINRIFFAICFLIIIIYFGSRRLNSLGRTAELLLVLILSSLVLSLIISFKGVDLARLLPLFNTSFLNISRSMFSHSMWFGDFLVLFFLIGNIKKEKDTTKKIAWTYITTSLLVLTITIIFISAFGGTASMHRVALIDITEISPRLVAQGRFNWFVYMTFPITLVFGVGLYSNFVSMCIKFCIKDDVKSKNTISILIVTGMILAICLVCRFTYTAFYQLIINYFKYFVFAIQYVLPIVLLNMVIVSLKKSNRKKFATLSYNKMRLNIKVNNKNRSTEKLQVLTKTKNDTKAEII